VTLKSNVKLTTPFTCRAGCKELDVAESRDAGPVKCNGWLAADYFKYWAKNRSTNSRKATTSSFLYWSNRP
jgi:hypothetical protein